MTNYCNNTLSIRRLDNKSLAPEEIAAFIRKDDNDGVEVKGIDGNYYLSFQYVVPIVQDDNWRDNNINGWGVKWDGAYYCYGTLTDTELYLDFGTPWSPPDKWLKAVCKKFPELYISMEYDEPGCGFQGEMGRDEDGKLFDNYRDGNKYMHTCCLCGYHYENDEIHYDEEEGDFVCNECTKKFLDFNKGNNEKGG